MEDNKEGVIVLNPETRSIRAVFLSWSLFRCFVTRCFSARFGLFRAGEPFSVGSEACRHTQPWQSWAAAAQRTHFPERLRGHAHAQGLGYNIVNRHWIRFNRPRSYVCEYVCSDVILLLEPYPNSASVRPHKLCLSVRPPVPEPKLPRTGLRLVIWSAASSWRARRQHGRKTRRRRRMKSRGWCCCFRVTTWVLNPPVWDWGQSIMIYLSFCARKSTYKNRLLIV